ncbi:YL1 nuclear protein-domain-containing protein, partial [Blyttiomyces helicus]
TKRRKLIAGFVGKPSKRPSRPAPAKTRVAVRSSAAVSSSPPVPKKSYRKKQVAFDVQVVGGAVRVDSGTANPIRSSVRASTVQSAKILVRKLDADRARKAYANFPDSLTISPLRPFSYQALIPRKEKVVERELTQEEKLEEAKETERLNLASLERIEELEEENKRRHMRRAIPDLGPVIRFHSFRGDRHPILASGALDPGTPGITAIIIEAGDDEILVVDTTGPVPRFLGGDGRGGPSKVEYVIDRVEEEIDVEGLQEGGVVPVMEGNHRLVDVESQIVDALVDPSASANAGEEPLEPELPPERTARALVTFVDFREDPFLSWAQRPSPSSSNFLPSYFPAAMEKYICPISGNPARYIDPRSGLPYATKEAYRYLQTFREPRPFGFTPVTHSFIHTWDAPTLADPANALDGWVDSTFAKPKVDGEGATLSPAPEDRRDGGLGDGYDGGPRGGGDGSRADVLAGSASKPKSVGKGKGRAKVGDKAEALPGDDGGPGLAAAGSASKPKTAARGKGPAKGKAKAKAKDGDVAAGSGASTIPPARVAADLDAADGDDDDTLFVDVEGVGSDHPSPANGASRTTPSSQLASRDTKVGATGEEVDILEVMDVDP